MRIFMIDDRIPRVELGAGFPRANAAIHALLPLCERLSFYPLNVPDEDEYSPYAQIDPRVELLTGRGRSGLRETLREYADLGFDVFWVSRPDNMRYVSELLAEMSDLRERITLVYDAEAIYAPRTVHTKALRGELIDAKGARELLDEEFGLARRADLLVSVSKADAQILSSETGKPTLVLGFTSIPDPTLPTFWARRDFGFVGGIWDESPNDDAVLWYAANVMHDVHKRTGAALRLAGHNDSRSLPHYAGDELQIVGSVPDLREFFDQIRVFIAPTRCAAGLPQKLIDAASAGVPIVATSMLASALGWRNGKDLLVADDAPSFATACTLLYQDSYLWQHLREGALAAVRVDYGAGVFETQLAVIVDMIEELADLSVRAIRH